MKNSRKRCVFTLIWITLSVFYIFDAAAQGNSAGYLYVYPSDPSAYPDQQGNVSNPTLQTLFQQYQVVGYLKSFPGAASQQLQNAHEIHLNGDPGSFKTALENTGLFSLIEVETYMQALSRPLLDCPEPCSNPQSVNDPNSGYELTLPGYPCAWNITQGNSSIVVAVVDTDFDLNHPDLQGQIISKTGVPGAPDCAYHGTAVAGAIVAKANNGINVAGVAPGVRVAGYVVTSNGNCPNCLGLPWPMVWKAYQDGHRIINVSWNNIGATSFANVTVPHAIQEMTDNGVLLVVAAGNRYGQTNHSTYSNIPGVVNVGSVTANGTIHPSNDDPNQPGTTYNQWVDLCAPGYGVGIIEIDCNGNLYNIASGTSQSAPNVSGAAALILSVNPCLRPAEIEYILEATACPLINNPIPNETGAGYLNAYAAVEMALGRSGTLNQNETWDETTYVPSNLTITGGTTLTINGTVKFSEGASLIIQPGGRVNLYGTLTNSCMGAWDGVIVEGLANESQYTAGKHGRLYTYDGAVIENAITGVKLVDGGIVYGYGTTFKNDGAGVVYSSYSNFWPFQVPAGQFGQPRNHFGGINNCTFLWNDDFKKALPLGSGVSMLEVRGIGISGCSFVNERTIKNPMSIADYGYGIKATDALFSVSSMGIGNTYPPSGYDHTMFKGLGYGVYVGTAQPGTNGTLFTADDFVNVPYTVQQATFTECIYGIHNRFVSQGTIVGNTFYMGKLPPAGSLSGNTPFTNTQVGVFIENGANGFELQENSFVKVEDNVDYAYGSYCQNLGWFNNDVRRNTYTNVNAGNLADEDNATLDPVRGLYYLCNTNTTQEYDFHVFSGGDIRLTQGVELGGNNIQAAGNGFTNANAPHGDFNNNGPKVRYFRNQPSEEPEYHFGIQFPFFFGQINDCISEYCLPPCRTKDEWPLLRSGYDTHKTLYLSAVTEMKAAQAAGNDALAQQKSDLAAGHRLRMDEISNTLSLHMAFDTVTFNVDSVRIWWQKMDSPISDMIVARDLLAKGQNSRAFAVFDAIPTKYSLSEGEVAELNGYRAIMEILQDESAISLAPSKVQQLLGHANNSKGVGAAWAKNILTIHGYHFPPQPKPLGDSERSQKEESRFQKPDLYLVSPNPARDQVHFVRNDAKIGLNTSVIVTDATGHIIWRSPVNSDPSNIVWQTGNTQSGVYFYSIQDAGGPTQSGRIVLVK